ncbi:MAG: FAD-dependent oxidoreductase [Ruminococcaceae bacterium]|nr:FAD-dependent oxidoreductase [Oscillospiraceae bacterium]
MPYDKIIIGAGLYGLYAARFCGRQGQRVLLLEKDAVPFSRATTINQARVHMGYHYPRSLSTALGTRDYFERFVDDFAYCIKADFQQVYATSAHFSWTNATEFKRFCNAANIPCDEISPDKYFKPGLCDGAFITREYTYDAVLLRRQLLDDLAVLPNVQLRFSAGVTGIEQSGGHWVVHTAAGEREQTAYLLNTAYAGVNEVNALAGFEPFSIKYELCEMILCEADHALEGVGITVMDGPFFSIMPFGRTGMHSLTSVTFTPHLSSREKLPAFPCQAKSGGACTPENLANCNDCAARPQSAWPSMSQLARKYLREEYDFVLKGSLFSMKPVLKASEVDDSRPTLVRVLQEGPTFVSVLSGKISTVYDLEEVL